MGWFSQILYDGSLKSSWLNLYFFHRTKPTFFCAENFPEFVDAATVDDIQVGYCDSTIKKAEPKQEWMRKFILNDTATLGVLCSQMFWQSTGLQSQH